METNQFIKATVGVVVVFLVIVAVAIPVISGINLGTTTTLDIDGQRYSAIDDPITVSFVSSDSSSITIDIAGETHTYTEAQKVMEIIGYGFTLAVQEPGGGWNDFRVQVSYQTERGSSTFNINSYFNSMVIEKDRFSYAPDFEEEPLIGPVYLKNDSGGYVLFTEGSVNIPVDVPFIGIVTSSGINIKSGLFENGIMTKYGKDEQDEFPDYYDTEPFEISDGMVHITLPVVYWPPDVGTFDALIIPLEHTVISEIDAAIESILDVVPLLLVVGLIIAAVAAFITLKSRDGGA